ncbi:MAG: T9SS type A sorting domain-containing protein, partial [Armatimonadetes bacterium]|nr:T9SS type A sorting domain-containing protein [Armatimonadota bacterium]
NVSNPANPELMAYYWFDLTNRKLTGAGDILIAYGSDILLEKLSNVVFRIMPDGSLEELDRLYSQDIWIDGLHYHPDYGFFLTENDTLRLYTLDEDDKLEEIFTLEIPEINYAEFIFYGNVAYIVGQGKMLVLANIDDITQMSVVHEIEIEDYSYFLSYGIYENLLFLGSNDFIFENKVYDISQPENPILFAELDNLGVVSIDAENGILFAGFSDTYAFDISNIATTGTALEIQEFPVWNRTEDLYTFQQNGEYYFYILDQNSCRIFHYDTTAIEDDIVDINPFLKNYPNPFNPETIISFSIPNQSNVELTVFNFKGQKVKQLLSNSASLLSSGQHSVVWDGTDDNNKSVSSGIYLYKLKVDDKTMAARKCILLK